MRIERLELTGFRSYADLRTEFGGGPQVIVGANATGKTNLLEALVVLGSGSSHRASSDSELISWGADFARLAVSARDDRGAETSVEVVLAGSGAAGGRKRIKLNGVPRRAATLPSALPVVLFAPEDMLLIVGSPALRRSALDALVGQLVPTAGSAFTTYGRALTQRNNLLRALRDGLAERAELDFWDRTLCEEGGRILEWRRQALADLAGPLAAAQREIAPAEDRLELRYVTNTEPATGESAADALARRLRETAEKELWNGATLVGPHRDDVSFRLGRHEMEVMASRGQQRSAILAFKLAQLELLRRRDGRFPLLLLDDVFSELDPERRAHLVRRIAELPQAFVTTTTLEDLDPTLVATSTAWQVMPGALERVA